MLRTTFSRLRHFRELNRVGSTRKNLDVVNRAASTLSPSAFPPSLSSSISLINATDSPSSSGVHHRYFSGSSVDLIDNKNNDNGSSDNERNDDPAVTTSVDRETNGKIDEESLLAEYYRSYSENVWTAGNDDERDVRWMEMLGNRGVEGVFDIEELVDVLKAENVQDIVCIRVPDDMNYTDYLIIGTGFSFRHLKSVMEYVKKLHKGKKWKKDPVAKIEGLESEDWLVMDMGNIVLHLLKPEAREEWDLDTLWAVGTDFDELSLEGRRGKIDIENLIYVADDEVSWELKDSAGT